MSTVGGRMGGKIQPNRPRRERVTVDWQALREAYAARRRAEGATEDDIRQEQYRADQVVWTPRKAKAPIEVTISKKGKALGPRKTTPVREIVLRWRSGQTVPGIAHAEQVSQKTVRKYLKLAGIETGRDRGGPAMGAHGWKDLVCKRGHRVTELTALNRPEGAGCAECAAQDLGSRWFEQMAI